MGINKVPIQTNNDRKMNSSKLEGTVRDSMGLKVY